MNTSICQHCGGQDFIEDPQNGDLICQQDGYVLTCHSIVETQPEYRLFQNDATSQQRVRLGQSYNIYDTVTSPFSDQDDGLYFLNQGRSDIQEVFHKIYRGDTRNKEALDRASYYFSLVYQHQQHEKDHGLRTKFSRRKQFAITCVWRALYEQREKEKQNGGRRPWRWSIDTLNTLIPGFNVSHSSVEHCLDDLDQYVYKARQQSCHKNIHQF